jgi:hypothetical protein
VAGLAAGTYSITVEYVANAYFSGATSAAQTFQVNQVTPTVTLGSITAVAVGSDLTLTANVSGTGIQSPVGGSVSFYLGGTAGKLLGTDTTISSGGDVSISVDTGDGQALAVAGTAYINIVAHFDGLATNGNVAAATSAEGSVTLTKRNSTATTTSGSTAVKGSNIVLNATVAAASTPSSTVSVACTACLQFQIDVSGTWTIIVGAVDVSAAGAATLTVPTGSGVFPNVGTYSIRAVYAGNTNYNAATSPGVNAVITPPAPTSITVTGASIVYLSSGSVAATIVPSDSASAVCSNCLRFKVGATYASATTFATVSVSNVGTAQAPIYRGSTSIRGGDNGFDDVGTYQVWAEYLGSTNVGPGASATSATVTITAAPTTVSVSGDATGSIGSSESFTLTHTARAGTVKLFVDGTEVDSEAADTDGSSTLEWTPTDAGPFTITATFTPTSTNFSASTSSGHSITISQISVSITVTDLANSGTTGVAISLSASVSPTAAPGTIKFFATTGGVTTEIGSDTTLTSGVGTFSWTPTVAATYSISATYESSSGNYADDLTSANNQNINISAPAP